MRSPRPLLVTLAVSALVVVGCGGASASGAAGGSSAGGEVAGESEGFDMEGFGEGAEPEVHHGTASARELLGVTSPPVPFDELGYREQADWMIGHVLPIAAEDFGHYDPDRFTDVTCALCHGDDAEARGYAMPSPSLRRLPSPGSADWDRLATTDAYAFMHDVVTPTMATLLGRDVASAEHPDGFGCFGCHTARD